MELESNHFNSEVKKYINKNKNIEYSSDKNNLYINKKVVMGYIFISFLTFLVSTFISLAIPVSSSFKFTSIMSVLELLYFVGSITGLITSIIFDDIKPLKNKLLKLQTFDFDMTMLNPEDKWKLPVILNLYKDFEKVNEYNSLLTLINIKDYQKINLILANTNTQFLRKELLKEYNKDFVEQTLEARDILNGEGTKTQRLNEEFLDNLITLNSDLSIMKHLDKNINEMNPIDKSNYQKIHSTLLEAHEIIKNSDYISAPESKSKDIEKFNKLVKISLPTLENIKENLHNSKSDKLDVAAIYLSDALQQPLQIEGNLHKVDDFTNTIKTDEKIEKYPLPNK